LAGGTDEALLAWVQANGKPVTDAEIRLFSRNLLKAEPKDDETRRRFQGRLQEIAAKRGVPVTDLSPVSTWADVIELDEGRM
jgi:sugar phosphate isomerase/epimerase